MIGRRLVNGAEAGAIAPDDRGLAYGDGLFETMTAADGVIRHFALHMARLEDGCHRLAIPMPALGLIEDECRQVLDGLGGAIVKLVVTRGPGPRGYRPPAEPSVTRVVAASARPVPPPAPDGIRVRVCATRLGINPRLAGIKHLNRLEQVLASNEWHGGAIAEGLMLATDDRLIGATAANLFLVRAGLLRTPDLRDCGVAGVMREAVRVVARDKGLDVEIGDLTLADLRAADEVFLTNAVLGIRPVRRVDDEGDWSVGAVTRELLEHAELRGPAA